MQIAIVSTTFIALFGQIASAGRMLRQEDVKVSNKSTEDHSELMPIQIPLDRVFDVQWNPPGYPTLSADWLQNVWNDFDEDRDGYYTFQDHRNGTIRFVRKAENGDLHRVFHNVDFLVVSNDVLMFNGDPHGTIGWPAGGGFGTLIKAPSIAAGDEGGEWNTRKIEDSDVTAEEWLLKTFGEDANFPRTSTPTAYMYPDVVPTPAPTTDIIGPPLSPSPTAEPTSEFVPPIKSEPTEFAPCTETVALEKPLTELVYKSTPFPTGIMILVFFLGCICTASFFLLKERCCTAKKVSNGHVCEKCSEMESK